MASTKRSDGEGSLYRRHKAECPEKGKATPKCSCPWQGAVVTGWRDGKPVRKKVTGKSRPDAVRKLRELQEKAQAGLLPTGRPPTVEEWLTYWLEEIVEKQRKPSTARAYRTCITRYIVPIVGDKRIDRLTPEDVASMWTELQEVGRRNVEEPKPLSSTTVHQCHRILARSLKVAQNRGKVVKNVATMVDDPPQPRKVEIATLDKKQALRLLATVDGRRNAARWKVALALGLRQGEALGLTWENVDLDAGTLRVRQSLSRVKGKGLVIGTVKSTAGERTIKLPAPLLRELKAHRTAQQREKLAARDWYADDDLVFAHEDGRPIDPKIDWREWKALLKEAELPDVRVHAARHTAATMLLAMGVSTRVAMEILGHSRITVTQKYQHVVDEMHDDAAEKMAAFWS